MNEQIAIIGLTLLADYFNVYKIAVLLDIEVCHLMLGDCKVYKDFPWSKPGVPSQSPNKWILVHLLIGLVIMNMSAIRLIHEFDRNSTFNKVYKWVVRLFCSFLLINFWHFLDFSPFAASIVVLSATAAVYKSYDCVDSEKPYMKRLHFGLLYLAPALEIPAYIFRNS